MDGVTPAGDPRSAADRLRADAVALRESAERDQIEPGGTLGHWLRGQEAALFALANTVDHMDLISREMEAKVVSVIKNTRDLSVTEVHKLQQAVALAGQTIQSLKAMQTVTEVKTNQAVSALLASMRPALISQLSDMTVVWERRWNRRQNLIGVSAMSCLFLSIFTIAYLMGGGDARSRKSGDRAQAAIMQCLAQAQAFPGRLAPLCSAAVLKDAI